MFCCLFSGCPDIRPASSDIIPAFLTRNQSVHDNKEILERRFPTDRHRNMLHYRPRSYSSYPGQ